MTPERWTALAALLMEARDWVYDHDPSSLDGDMFDAAITSCAAQRRRMVEEGAK